MEKQYKIGVIGLGYVGLPLAVEFSKVYPVLGYDIDERRVNELSQGIDRTLEVSNEELGLNLSKRFEGSKGLYITSEVDGLQDCNVFIVTVPTPTDKNHRPVLTPLINASKLIGKFLKNGDIVVYESTVYPGVTEDECIPVLEDESKLSLNKDFFVGYSPERINPGDQKRTVRNILKITSGSNPHAAEVIDLLYNEIIDAGTYKAPSIKVAEAAKVIENSQRDVNIAFVNELSMIFNKLDIDTIEVLEAAGTKWNFLPFRPGLVGGHCIGVDPYYLAQKAEEVHYYPEMILASRRLNDGMGRYVASDFIKLLIKKNIKVAQANILMLGITFKENCPDIRNTKALDVYNELIDFGLNVDLYDPWVKKEHLYEAYAIDKIDKLDKKKYSGILITVAHDLFKKIEYKSLLISNGVIYDVKGLLPKEVVDGRL